MDRGQVYSGPCPCGHRLCGASCTRCTWTRPEGRRIDSVHRRPSLRSMDRERQSTMSHAVWAELWTKPSGGPWLRRGNATACHVVGQSLARIQAQPAQFGPGLC